MLTLRAERFADSWAGQGTGVAAARAAGYRGSAAALAVTACRLLRDPEVRRRIEARGLEAEEPGPEVAPVSSLSTERAEQIEILMAIARDPKAGAKERLRAIEIAARLGAPAKVGRVLPPAAAPKGSELVRGDEGVDEADLVLSEDDAGPGRAA